MLYLYPEMAVKYSVWVVCPGATEYVLMLAPLAATRGEPKLMVCWSVWKGMYRPGRFGGG